MGSEACTGFPPLAAEAQEPHVAQKQRLCRWMFRKNRQACHWSWLLEVGGVLEKEDWLRPG